MNNQAEHSRFWAKVQKSDGCWEWTASFKQCGYGQFHYKGRNVVAHRVSWLLTYGEIPKGKVICHHCDNRKCVRPEHLFAGTQRQNLQDAYAKGRLRIFGGGYEGTLEDLISLIK